MEKSKWDKIKERAVETKQRRHITKLLQTLSPSGEVSDKQFANQYAGDLKIVKTNRALIEKRIKDEVTKQQQANHERRLKNAPRKD